MHALHLRLPKHFVLEERLEHYARAIEPTPRSWRGCWAEACYPLGAGPRSAPGRFKRVHVDLGCGKGSFLVEAAQHAPDVLFVGIDNEPICIAYAAQAICEAPISNAVVVPGSANHIKAYFDHEVSSIYLNFPTPLPKARDAADRLTYYNRLLDYHEALREQGRIVFKTDSLPLWHWSLDQFRQPNCPFGILWASKDTRHEHPGDPETGYERKLTAKGACVYGICAQAKPYSALSHMPQPYAHPKYELNCHRSLVDYLPDDLSSLGYIPHGMEATVTNLANYRAKNRESPHA